MNFPAHSNLYDILGVTASASDDDIKSAFRSLALQHHPDKNSNSEESTARFKVIHNAYVVLSNPATRREYDAYLATSNVFASSNRVVTNRPSVRPTSRAVLRTNALSIVLDHLNYILWDIEELVRLKPKLDLKIGDFTVQAYVLMMLTFIDKWILDTSGFPDYFFQARKMAVPPKFGGTPALPHVAPQSGHRPYVNVDDYFYSIRKRADRLLSSARLVDLFAPVLDETIRVIDCILEAHNYCFHYLGHMRRVLNGEAEDIPPFHHSDRRFAEGG